MSRDITGALLEELFQDIAIKSILLPVSDDNLVQSTANTNGGAKLRKCKKLLDQGSEDTF